MLVALSRNKLALRFCPYGMTVNKIGEFYFGDAPHITGSNIVLCEGATFIIDIAAGGFADILYSDESITIEDNAKITIASISGKISVGEEFTILASVGGQIIDTSSLPFDVSRFANGDKLEFNGNKFDVVLRDSNKIVLITTYAAPIVPEPSTYALCGAIAALLLAFFRRHRRKAINN